MQFSHGLCPLLLQEDPSQQYPILSSSVQVCISLLWLHMDVDMRQGPSSDRGNSRGERLCDVVARWRLPAGQVSPGSYVMVLFPHGLTLVCNGACLVDMSPVLNKDCLVLCLLADNGVVQRVGGTNPRLE